MVGLYKASIFFIRPFHCKTMHATARRYACKENNADAVRSIPTIFRGATIDISIFLIETSVGPVPHKGLLIEVATLTMVVPNLNPTVFQ